MRNGINRTDALLVTLYIGVIIGANYAVTRWGQEALPFTAFLLIPFDLVIRDLLQDRMQVHGRRRMWWVMGWLVFTGSAVSYLSTTGSLRIATASFCAFLVTGVIDAITYQRMIRWGRVLRINLATIIAAFTDSVIFALIAFDGGDWGLILTQAGSKILGGVVWSLLLYRLFKRYRFTKSVKPTGTVSKMGSVSEGVHPTYGGYKRHA